LLDPNLPIRAIIAPKYNSTMASIRIVILIGAKMLRLISPALAASTKLIDALKARLDRASRRRILALVGPPAKSPPLYDPSLNPEQYLSIPVLDQNPDERACHKVYLRGQFLARQDRWGDLACEITSAEATRKTSPGGMPFADLLAYGARSDVVHRVEHALQDGANANNTALNDGIDALESMHRDHPDNPVITLIVALTHIDIGWAWRGTAWETIVPALNRSRCAAHFDRAQHLLSPLCGIELDSPLLAAARCAQLAGQRDPQSSIADDYEDLIDLDPHNYRHMRGLGNHLLPRWFGTYQQLELEARRTASRTQDIWGAGAYTWVYFDAIATDEQACANVDVGFFIDGLHDILKARPDQAMVNLLASYCAVALRHGLGLSSEADFPRMQIADCARWLIRDHLKQLHPMIWAHAVDGFDNNARVTSLPRFAARGQAHALQAIAEQFQDDIKQGQRVTFTSEGAELHSA
jgi:hypothetical protein